MKKQISLRQYKKIDDYKLYMERMREGDLLTLRKKST